jgi:hypothetical protein
LNDDLYEFDPATACFPQVDRLLLLGATGKGCNRKRDYFSPTNAGDKTVPAARDLLVYLSF